MVQNKNKNKQILEGSDTLRCLHLDKKKKNLKIKIMDIEWRRQIFNNSCGKNLEVFDLKLSVHWEWDIAF